MVSIDQPGHWPPCPAPFNMAAHALAHGSHMPDREALLILGPDKVERWSFGRLEAAVRGCGTGLLRRGLQPGDRVLMRLGNRVAFPILYLGAIAAGLVPVPTSALLTGPEISRIAARIAPALIVADPGVALPDPVPCPLLSGADVLQMADLPPCEWDMGDPDRLAYIVFTSGTSGRPQAVAHAHRALWARGMMREGWQGYDASDRVLHAGALNWTYTLGAGLLDPWCAGAVALVTADGVTVADLPDRMRQQAVTVLAAVPGVFRQLLRAGLPPLPDLRRALSAGEALPPALREGWEKATGTPLHEALGMTEVSTYVSGSDNRPAPQGAAGYAQPGRRIAVLGEDGLPVARNVAGDIAVARGDPGLMLGYLEDPVASAARFSGDWFVTGDRGVMAPDGAITLLGRRDDLMNAGGFRVSPLEVEAAFADLAEVAVAEVQVAADTFVIGCFHCGTVPEAQLRAHAETRLARWKQPRIYRQVDHLPRTANGKLNRKALRAPQEAT